MTQYAILVNTALYTQYAILANITLYTQYVIYYSSVLYIKLISFIYYTTAYARRRVRVRREITNIGKVEKKSSPPFQSKERFR